MGASRLWWNCGKFVEKMSFEPGMKQWMCDGAWRVRVVSRWELGDREYNVIGEQ